MIDDIPARDAYAALQADPRARLCDVRSALEWQHVGVPTLAGAAPVFVSWQLSPDMRHNTQFITELQASGVATDQPVYFICRSGVRSAAAAAAAAVAGYRKVYNVAEGFEGRPGQPGWAAQGLPARLP